MGNFQVKPLVDTVVKALGNVGKGASSSVRVSGQNVKNNNRAKDATSVLSNQQKLGAVQAGASSAWAVTIFLVSALFFVLIPLIKVIAEKWGHGAKKVLGALIENTTPGPGGSLWVVVPLAALRILLYTAWIFLDRAFIPFFQNAYFIVGYVLLASFLVFAGERHPDSIISALSEVTDVGVLAANALGYALQALVELENLVSPVTNMITRFQFFVMMTISNGVQATIAGTATFGRRLESQLGVDGVMDTFGEIFLLAGHVYNAMLMFTTTVIRILFDLGIIPFISNASKLIVAVVTKFVCAIAGGFCVFNQIGAEIYAGLVGLFGGLIPANNEIACGAEIFRVLGVGPMCAGSFLSIEPPGLYWNLDPQPRRSTMECVQMEGAWHEQIDGETYSSNANSSLACPMIRSSQTPLGHALNMKVLSTHDCYGVCVGGVKYEQCQHEVRRLVGPCGGRVSPWTRMAAKRRLDSIFTAPTASTPIWLGVDKATRRRLSLSSFSFDAAGPAPVPLDARNSRDQNIEVLMESVGSPIFMAPFGGCDLARGSSDIFEVLYDGACAVHRLWSRQQQQHGGRRLQEAAPSEHLEWADQMRHDVRIMEARYAEGSRAEDHPLMQNNAGSAAGTLFYALGRLTQPCPEGLVRCAPSIKCVQSCPRPKPRRLEARCPDNQLLCPNEVECVDSLNDCYDADSYSVIGSLRMFLLQLSSMLASLDIGGFLDDTAMCWWNYWENPDTDPYYGLNLEAPIEELRTRAVWCAPMWAPFDWVFEPWKYSLRDSTYAACKEISPDFVGCRCPMFYPLPSATHKVGPNLSMDLGFVLANGLIWFKNIFAYLTGDVVGYVWSGVFPAYMWGPAWAYAFSLYRSDTAVYGICYATHAGSAMWLVMALVLAVVAAGMIWSLLMMCWRGGKLELQRNKEKMERLEETIEKNTADIARIKQKMARKS